MNAWRPGRDPRAELHAPSTLLDPGVAASGHDRDRDHVVVVGGGIAGIAAATTLAEAGARVTLLERGDRLGGRVASWTHPDGRSMSRGFHAFFRQYYNLRELLRRADPDLSFLTPLEDYPLVHVSGRTDSFAGLPTTPPFSVAAFALRSRSFPARQLARVDLRRAMSLLTVDFPASFADYDDVSAAEVLDRLRFPADARHLALEVFARSFFADPRDFSGAELVAMFHAYFMGSAEGLLFDVPDGDYDRVLWAPMAAYLTSLGVEIRTNAEVTRLDDVRGDERGPVRVQVRDGSAVEADAVVLATDVGPLRRIVADTPWLGDLGWRERVSRIPNAPRFAVWRLWFDRPTAEGTPPFVGTAGTGLLDNVSALHLYEEEARAWADEHGGSVVELHAYALPDHLGEDAVRADLRDQLRRLHPELDDAIVVEEEWLVRDDCVLVGPGAWTERTGIVTPDPRVVLAGDGIRVDLPCALMERAATTGILAASAILQSWGQEGRPVWSVPTTGVLARRRFRPEL